MAKWDVIVVGAGLSGLGVGALLANAGKKTLVLEKENHIGGRAFSRNYKGHVLDNGVHGPSRAGYLEDIFAELGRPYPSIGPLYNKGEIFIDGTWKDINSIYPHTELRGIIENIANSSYEELEKYDAMSIKDWVSTKTDNEGIHYFFWHWAVGACVGNRFGSLSASETLITIKQQLDRRGKLAGIGPIIGGVSKLTEPMADVIREKEGDIRTGIKVSSIVIEGGKVLGVEIETGEKVIPSQLVDTELIEAPVVVSTLPLWDLFTIVSEDEFPRWYTDWIEAIHWKISNVWSVIHATDQPLWDESTMRWVPKLPRSQIVGYFMWFPTYGESVGQYQVHFFTQGLWDELPSVFQMNRARTRRQIATLLDLFEEDIEELFPDLKKHSLWKVRQASAYSISQAPSLVGKFRPQIQVPGVDNLYLVSDTVREARGPGMQAVANAVLQCADLILGK